MHPFISHSGKGKGIETVMPGIQGAGQWNRWSMGDFQGSETCILYDTVIVDKRHFEFIKTHRTVTHNLPNTPYSQSKAVSAGKTLSP